MNLQEKVSTFMKAYIFKVLLMVPLVTADSTVRRSISQTIQSMEVTPHDKDFKGDVIRIH